MAILNTMSRCSTRAPFTAATKANCLQNCRTAQSKILHEAYTYNLLWAKYYTMHIILHNLI